MNRSLVALGLAVFLGLAALGPQPSHARSAEQWTQLQLDELRRAHELDKRRYRKAKRLMQRQRQKEKAIIRRGHEAMMD